MENQLYVSSPPHIRSKESISSIMSDVIIALLPAVFAGIYYFGFRAAMIIIITVISSVVFEYLWSSSFKKPTTVWDLSAVVSGIILALNVPVAVPLWIPVVGSFFMIIIVKMCFGGIGQNFMNPAAAARAFLLASWPVYMTTFSAPFAKLNLFATPDVVSTATPLSILKGTEPAIQELPNLLTLYFGRIGGSIGETSSFAILIGALYLLCRGIIDWKIPTFYIGTAAVIAYIFGGEGLFAENVLYHIFSGGLLFGAVFMATDYTTSPTTPKGKIIYGIGLGVLTMLIRLKGGYPEGVTYSILLMNIATPLIDKATMPKQFGGRVKNEK